MLSNRERLTALVLSAPLTKADAIVVLAGQDGEERAAVAYGLIQQGAADTVLLTGGLDAPDKKSAQTLSGALMGSGVSPSRIMTENHSTNTKEQAEAVREIAKEKEWKNLLLVASPHHAPRAFLTFIKAFQGMDVRIVPCTANQTAWWGKPKGVTTTRLALLDDEFRKIELYQESGDCAHYVDGIKHMKKHEAKP